MISRSYILTLLLCISLSCGSTTTWRKQYVNARTANEYKSVVRVGVRACIAGYMSLGTGIATGPHTVYTAKHVVQCNDGNVTRSRVKLLLHDGSVVVAHVVAIAPSHDVVRLYIDKKLLNYVKVDKREMKIRERVCYVGGNRNTKRLLTKCGLVTYTHPNAFEVGIHGVPGNSGGPVLDVYGRLVGLLIQRDISGEHISLSVSSLVFP